MKIRIGGQHGIAGIEEGGFRDEILVLCRAVESLLLQEEVGRKAIVEHPKARAENGLGRFLSAAVDAPGDADPRSKIGMIAEIILAFQSKPVAKGDIRADSPFVLDVQPRLAISNSCHTLAYPHRAKTLHPTLTA